MIKFINRLTNTLLALTGVAAVIGLVYTLKPELFQYAFETLNLTDTQVALASTVLSGIAVFGSLSKYFKGIINTQQALNKSETDRKLNYQHQLHQAELEEIKNSRVEELVIYAEAVNDLTELSNTNLQTNKLILQNLAITAHRNIKSNLVSEEDKEAYKQFLDAYNNTRDTKEVKYLYSEVTVEKESLPEAIETKEEDIEDIFQKKLKGNK